MSNTKTKTKNKIVKLERELELLRMKADIEDTSGMGSIDAVAYKLHSKFCSKDHYSSLANNQCSIGRKGEVQSNNTKYHKWAVRLLTDMNEAMIDAFLECLRD